MVHSSFFHALRRRLVWLLCVAVLLPAAQLAAATHALSHVAQQPSQEAVASTLERDTAVGDLLHCAGCVAAAAVGTSAPPPVMHGHAAAHAAPTAPAFRPGTPLTLAPERRPAIRGPPDLPA